MKETDIRRYAGLMKELGLTGLEITEENSKVRLERSISAPVRETVYSVPESAGSQTTPPTTGPKDYISGIPHRRRVLCGSHGKCRSLCLDRGQGEKGQTLCIVEAMKLMNEILQRRTGSFQNLRH